MNNKQVIKINENQLRQIVTGSVKKVLKEGQENTYGTLIDIMNKLDMIIHSGFIPFSSPSPSSTEKKSCRFNNSSKRIIKTSGYWL